MAEIVDKQDLLERIRPFSPLRRVLLATPGTLQATLSAFFGTAIGVRVKRQQEAAGTLLRTVSLVLPDLELEVCSASTKARVTDPQMRRLLWERTLGIGRIAAMLGASASFRLDDAGEATATFWRVYQLWGAGFHYRIREAFPGSLYPDGVRWDVARLDDVLRNVPTI